MHQWPDLKADILAGKTMTAQQLVEAEADLTAINIGQLVSEQGLHEFRSVTVRGCIGIDNRFDDTETPFGCLEHCAYVCCVGLGGVRAVRHDGIPAMIVLHGVEDVEIVHELSDVACRDGWRDGWRVSNICLLFVQPDVVELVSDVLHQRRWRCLDASQMIEFVVGKCDK